MAEVKLNVNETKLMITSPITLVSTGVNYDTCRFSFGPEWEGYTKTAVFYSDMNTEPISMILNENDICTIPWESMDKPGILYIGVFGIKDNIEIPTNFVTLRLIQGAAGNNAPPPPSLSVYKQILDKVAEVKAVEESFNAAELERKNNEEERQRSYLEFKGDIKSGTGLKNELKTSITTGVELDNKLKEDISLGNTLDLNLKDDINLGDALDLKLKEYIATGNTLKTEIKKDIEEAEQVKQETEQLIEKGGAATKGDIQKVSTQLEHNANNSLNVINLITKKDLFVKQENGYNISNALQTLINQMSVGGTIFIPDGSYYIDRTIKNSSDIIIKIISSNAHFTVGGWITNCSSRLYTNVNGIVFDGRFSFENIACENRIDNESSFCNSPYSMISCYITKFDYGINGVIGGLSIIRDNYLIGCKKACIKGNIIDSYIYNNYISGTNKGVYGILSDNISLSTIEGNFIDFCEYGIKVNIQCTSNSFSNNQIDYCYRGLYLGGVDGCNINGNRFYHTSKKYCSRCGYGDEYFNDWIAMHIGSTIIALTINNNSCSDTDLMFRFLGNPNGESRNIKTSGNITTGKIGTFSSATGDETNINIKEMNNITYTVQPTKYNTFYNQEIYYNGYKYKNIKGELVVISKEIDVNQNYTEPIELINDIPNGCKLSLNVQGVVNGGSVSNGKFKITSLGNQVLISTIFNTNTNETYLKINVYSEGKKLFVKLEGQHATSETNIKCYFD